MSNASREPVANRPSVNDVLRTLRVGDVIKSTRTLEVTDDFGGFIYLKDVQSGTTFHALQDGVHGSWQIEMVKKAAPKVGDTIEGRAAYDSLPKGAVVSGFGDTAIADGKGNLVLARTNHGKPQMWEKGHSFMPRTLVYLPS